MVQLNAPRTIVVGEPFSFAFESEERVSGRLRLTAGKEAVPFTLERPDRNETGPTHRIRGKKGTFRILDWGEHPLGTELVLRFEGAKLWLMVGERADTPE